MANRRPFTFIVLATLVSRALSAQAAVSAGASFPRGDLATNGVGFHVTAMAQTLPTDSNQGFRLEGAYHRFVRKGTTRHITERVLYSGASVVVHPPTLSPTLPYFVGGVGAYNRGTTPSPANSSSTTNPGYTLGAGIQFRARGWRAFSEVRLHKMFTDPGAGLVAITAGRVF